MKFAQEAPTKSAVLYQSFFSETGLKNSREIPAKSAVFFRKFAPEYPAKFDFFSRDLPEALTSDVSISISIKEAYMYMLQLIFGLS